MREHHQNLLQWAIALWLACAIAAPVRAQEPGARAIVAVVADTWEGPAALDLTTLRRIYLGQLTRIRGQRVRPLNLPLGSREREGFSRVVLKRSPESLERYWIQQALEGGPHPPREVSDAGAMLRIVRSSRRAVGYLALADLADRTRIRVLSIEVDGRVLEPGDPDYPLRMSADR